MISDIEPIVAVGLIILMPFVIGIFYHLLGIQEKKEEIDKIE